MLCCVEIFFPPLVVYPSPSPTLLPFSSPVSFFFLLLLYLSTLFLNSMGSSVFCISRVRPFHAFGPMYAILLLYFSVFGFLIFINLFLPSLVITFVPFCFHPPKPLLLEIWNMCCSRCCYLLSFSFSSLASLCSSFVLYRFSLLSAHSRALFCNTSFIGRIAFLYISSAAFSVMYRRILFSCAFFQLFWQTDLRRNASSAKICNTRHLRRFFKRAQCIYS